MDLNSDGYQDILSGSYSHMSQPMAGVFQVMWGQADASLKSAEVLTGTDGKPLIIPVDDIVSQGGRAVLESICTRPTAVDWDADGDLDLVVGNFGGSFYLFLGEGEGRFQPIPQPILSKGSPLKVVGAHSDPFIVDWDQDGDLDLLSGSGQGGVQWAENTAGAEKFPELAAFVTLIPIGQKIDDGQLLKESDLVGPASSTRIWVDDVDADGKLDILVGDNVRLISPAEGVSEQEYKQKLAKWQEQLQEASEELSALMEQGEADEDKQSGQGQPKQGGFVNWLQTITGLGKSPSELEQAQERMTAIYQQRSEFMSAESTGFVWLYLQK